MPKIINFYQLRVEMTQNDKIATGSNLVQSLCSCKEKDFGNQTVSYPPLWFLYLQYIFQILRFWYPTH